jgi:hypothetical protein
MASAESLGPDVEGFSQEEKICEPQKGIFAIIIQE